MQYDFRAVYASILEQWFGKSSIDRQQVLLKDFDTVPIIQNAVVSTQNRLPRSRKSIRVFPNPIQASSVLEVDADGQPIRIDLLDIQGRMVTPLFSGLLPKGKQQLPLTAHNLPAGNYIVRMQQAGKVQSVQVVKAR